MIVLRSIDQVASQWRRWRTDADGFSGLLGSRPACHLLLTPVVILPAKMRTGRDVRSACSTMTVCLLISLQYLPYRFQPPRGSAARYKVLLEVGKDKC